MNDAQGALFTEDELRPKPPPPVVPPQWAGYPAGPDRGGKGQSGCFTGPCLYDSPARGLAARTAEYELWAGLFGSFGCAVDSHAWRPARFGSGGALDRHEPVLLDCDLRPPRWRGRPEPVIPPCGHDADWLGYRSACLKDGCDWEGPARERGNPAVEDGMDHAHPGWRDLPPVPGVPGYGGNPNTGSARKALDAWAAKVNAVYPEFWLENGGPIRTVRDSPGQRHVEARTPFGGYDLSISTRDAEELGRRLAPQGSLL